MQVMVVYCDLYWVPGTFKVMVPVMRGHDNSEHFLIAYSVVEVRWQHVLRPIGNQVPVAITSRFIAFCAVRSTLCTTSDLVLLL